MAVGVESRHRRSVTEPRGSRLHPGIAEIRQQQLALARLLATLGVPGLAEDDPPTTRGVRGVYRGRR